MSKVSNLGCENEEKSFYAKVTHCLIKLNMFPVKMVSSMEAHFSLFSMRTSFYLIFSYLPFLAILIVWLAQTDFASEYFEKCSMFYTKFELMVFMVFLVIKFLSSPLFMISICKPLCRLQKITLSSSLRGLKKYDNIELFIGTIMCFAGEWGFFLKNTHRQSNCLAFFVHEQRVSIFHSVVGI